MWKYDMAVAFLVVLGYACRWAQEKYHQPPARPSVRDSAAGKIHQWGPGFRKMSADDPFTAKDLEPLYEAEKTAVAHHHHFRYVRPFGMTAPKVWVCECGIAYGKSRFGSGWKTKYLSVLAKRNYQK